MSPATRVAAAGGPERALRETLAALDAGGPAGDPDPDALLEQLRRFLDRSGNLTLPCRLARALAERGQADLAAAIYRAVLAIDPGWRMAATALGTLEEGRGDPAAAWDALAPLIARGEPAPALHWRGYQLLRRLGRTAQKEALCRRALDLFPGEAWPLETLLRDLIGAGRFAEAAAWAPRVLDAADPSPQACLNAFAAAVRAEAEAREALRARCLAVFAQQPNPDFWIGRLHQAEFRWEEAIAALQRAVAAAPDDPQPLRVLARIVIARGRVGQHAGVLLAAAERITDAPDLARSLSGVEGLFAAFVGSLRLAAAGDARLAALGSPGSVFAHVCRMLPPNPSDPSRRGLIMVGLSLAAGGAERVMATLYRELRRRRAEPVRLCLFRCTPGSDDAFYLGESGAAAEEILLATPVVPREAPMTWLPPTLAGPTQALYDLFMAERPAVVHATLDLPNLCAALAGLHAGVPRIVLHVHSVSPARLEVPSQFAPDFELCYRHLLARPEVVLVGVAEAALADYLDWIGAPPGPNTLTVHNGFDLVPFAGEAARAAAAALRRSLGLGPEALLVGTAFRFAEVKRPDLWVEMAIALAPLHPEAQFILFGDGVLRARAEQRVQAADLGGRVHFPGRVANLPELIGALDLFVLTSRTEGLPNVLIEAQAAGVPVVAFDVGGAADTMAVGETGRLVPAEAPLETLVATVDAAMRDRAWLDAARGRAIGLVRGRFAIDRMADRMEAILFGKGPIV